jgi:effector-binding domain-containing protein
MIETPQITQTEERNYACLHLTVPRAAIQRAMGPAVREVYAAVASQGIVPAGPWFTHHLKRPDTEFDFEACVPVGAAIAPAGRVTPGIWPAMRVARTVYQGDYAGLGAAWGEFVAWIGNQGLSEAQDLWERYLVGPESSANPADWRTELNRPLVG